MTEDGRVSVELLQAERALTAEVYRQLHNCQKELLALREALEPFTKVDNTGLPDGMLAFGDCPSLFIQHFRNACAALTSTSNTAAAIVERIEAAERKRCDRAVCVEWHRGVQEYSLRPGSPTEEVVGRILEHIRSPSPPALNAEQREGA